MANVAKGKAEKKSIGESLRSLPEFANQVKTEVGKIVWPTRRETVTTAIMVVIMAVLLGLFFFAVDSLFSAIVQALLGLLSS